MVLMITTNICLITVEHTPFQTAAIQWISIFTVYPISDDNKLQAAVKEPIKISFRVI